MRVDRLGSVIDRGTTKPNLGEMAMCRRFPVLAICLALAGCLTPVTSRLDRANEQLAASNQQLTAARAKLDAINEQLAKMDARLTTVERVMKLVPGGKQE